VTQLPPSIRPYPPSQSVGPWREAPANDGEPVTRPAWWRTVDLDGVFAFAMFLPMVFLLQLGTKGAAAFVGATVLYTAMQYRRANEILVPRLFLLIPGALACFSLVWSDLPVESLKYGLELGVTLMAALVLSSAQRPDMVLRGIAAAFFIYIVASLIGGGSVAIGMTGGTAFSGLTNSKNLVADIASTGLIITLGAAWLAARGRSWWWAAGLAVAAALEILVIVEARSAGAMLAVSVGLAAMFALAALRLLPTGLRGIMTVVLGFVVLMVGLFYRSISAALVEFATVAFDKDPSLTGRTYLWGRAFDLINEKPLLGRGFHAFWQQGNPDAEGLWRYAGIIERSGFTFHNTFIEILVQLGWTGLVILCGVLIIGILCLAVRFVRAPTIAICVWGGVLMYELVRMPIESIGYEPFFFSTVLLTAALGMAFSPAFEAGRVRQAQQQPSARVIRLREFRPRPAR